MSKIPTNRIIEFILLLIINIYKINNNPIYKIQFGLYSAYDGEKKLSLLENIFYDLVYVNLSIGTPSQIIPFELNINSQTFYVPNKYFNPNKSSTYKSLSKGEESYSYEDVKAGFNSKDILKIDNIEEEINFIFETKTSKDNDLGNIGLLIPFRFQTDILPFFKSLKVAGIINSHTFTFKYFNNISLADTLYNYGRLNKPIGQFIIGDDPHNYENDKNLYSESDYMKVGALYQMNGLFWDIELDLVYSYFNNDNSRTMISNKTFAEINPNNGYIYTTSFYFNLIKKNFFNKYKDICKEKNLVDNYYTYIECNKDNNFHIESFPTIYFENKPFETIFNLTYEDLFVFDEVNNKYIFLILYSRLSNNWIFGSIFLKKYQFTFNEDSKTIGYYKSMNNYKREEPKEENNNNNKKGDGNENNNSNGNKQNRTDDKKNINENDNNKERSQMTLYIIIGILFFIFCILFLIFGMYLQKKCVNNKRKKRFNELEDENFDFDGNDKDKDLINSNKNKKFDENQGVYDENGHNIN